MTMFEPSLDPNFRYKAITTELIKIFNIFQNLENTPLFGELRSKMQENERNEAFDVNSGNVC